MLLFIPFYTFPFLGGNCSLSLKGTGRPYRQSDEWLSNMWQNVFWSPNWFLKCRSCMLSRKCMLSLSIMLDRSKAFDTVIHTILISKLLKKFQFYNSTYNLICSYLTNSLQIPHLISFFLDFLYVTRGVHRIISFLSISKIYLLFDLVARNMFMPMMCSFNTAVMFS